MIIPVYIGAFLAGYTTSSGGGSGGSGVPFAAAYYDSTGVSASVSDYLAGALDAFQRPGVRDFRQNIGAGRGAVYKLGAWGQDGDPQNVMSEGYVTYGVTPTGLGPSGTDGGLGFFTPNSFGCYTVINGVNGNNTFPTCAYGDGGSWDPFGVNGFIMRDNTAARTVFLDRATGRGTFNQLQVGGGTGPLILTGAGSPEGSIVAPPGSLYCNESGGANTTLYVKESGVGNTGWIPK